VVVVAVGSGFTFRRHVSECTLWRQHTDSRTVGTCGCCGQEHGANRSKQGCTTRGRICTVFTQHTQCAQRFRPLLAPIIVMCTVADCELADRKESGHLPKQ